MLQVSEQFVKTLTDKYLPVIKKRKLSVEDKLALQETAKIGVLELFNQYTTKSYHMENGGYIMDMIVTPEIAKLLFASNPIYVKNNKKTGDMPNRVIGFVTVKEYGNQMKLGKWQETGEALKFATDGTLLDGQHRLDACIKNNIPFITVVVFNLPKKTMEAIDIGKTRDDGDFLKMIGYQHSAKFDTTIKFAMMYNKALNGTHSAYKQKMKIRTSLLHNEDIPEFLERLGFGDIGETTLHNSLCTAIDVHKEHSSISSVITPAKIAMLSFIIEKSWGVDIARAFMKKIYSLLNFTEGDPLSIYRDSMTRLRTKGFDTAMHGLEVRYLIRAWNQFVSGKVVKQLNGRDIDIAYPLMTVTSKNVKLYIDGGDILQRKII